MITIPIGLIIGIGALLLFILYAILERFVLMPFRYYVLGKKLYKYTKISSRGGVIEKVEWCKSEKEALSNCTWYEFVDCTYPAKYSKRVKPIEAKSSATR